MRSDVGGVAPRLRRVTAQNQYVGAGRARQNAPRGKAGVRADGIQIPVLAYRLKSSRTMKLASLSLLVLFTGCATSPPKPVLTAGQRQAFAEVIREAQAEGADAEPPEAARLLREAKSEFEYGQRLPKYPEKAKAVLAKAQSDAEAALRMARRRHQEQVAAGLMIRHDVATASAIAP